MKKKKNYDLYKVYGLLKLMQELNLRSEKLLDDVKEELNVHSDWLPNIDIQYNAQAITIEEVKELCEEYFNKEK